jgi:hypothetical protein
MKPWQLASLSPAKFAALEQRWTIQLAYWRRTRPEGLSLVPMSAQVAICDFWRERSRRRRVEEAAAIVAMHGGATSPLTVLRGQPWEDAA